MSDFAQLIAVMATCLTATIGVCVYLLKAQQKERERTETRNDARIDKLFGMLDSRIHEGNEVQRELGDTMKALGDAVRDQSRRLEAVEIAVSEFPRGRAGTNRSGSN